jgi:homoserine O-succinyltransferase/O-acetyltransferase
MDFLKIAVLDLYEGEANEGMRCIRQLLDHFGHDNQVDASQKSNR